MFIQLAVKNNSNILSELRKIMLGQVTSVNSFDPTMIDLSNTYVNTGGLYGQPSWTETALNSSIYKSPRRDGLGYKYIKFSNSAVPSFSSVQIVDTSRNAVTRPTFSLYTGIFMDSALDYSGTNLTNPLTFENNYTPLYPTTYVQVYVDYVATLTSQISYPFPRIHTNDSVLWISVSNNHVMIYTPSLYFRMVLRHNQGGLNNVTYTYYQITDESIMGFVDLGGYLPDRNVAQGNENPFYGFMFRTEANVAKASLLVQNKYNEATGYPSTGTSKIALKEMQGLTSDMANPWTTTDGVNRKRVMLRSPLVFNDMSAQSRSFHDLSSILGLWMTSPKYNRTTILTGIPPVNGLNGSSVWTNASDLLTYTASDPSYAFTVESVRYRYVGLSSYRPSFILAE